MERERRLYEFTSMERQQHESLMLAWECRGDGCGLVFTGEATREEHEHGEASVSCPGCGGVLEQEADPCAELESVLRRDERGVGEVYE